MERTPIPAVIATLGGAARRMKLMTALSKTLCAVLLCCGFAGSAARSDGPGSGRNDQRPERRARRASPGAYQSEAARRPQQGRIHRHQDHALVLPRPGEGFPGQSRDDGHQSGFADRSDGARSSRPSQARSRAKRTARFPRRLLDRTVRTHRRLRSQRQSPHQGRLGAGPSRLTRVCRPRRRAARKRRRICGTRRRTSSPSARRACGS